jgi:hypothetical protein
VGRLTDQEYRYVARALGTYNALGLYVRNKYVRKSDVMDMWAESICQAWKCAQPIHSLSRAPRRVSPVE